MVAKDIEELAFAAQEDLKLLSYPSELWVKPKFHGTEPVHPVIIIGGGQSGLLIAASLKREGVSGVAVLDRSPAGSEGVWDTFARMKELRTPKALNGMEFGCPNLSVQRWYMTRYGPDAWNKITRIPRGRWMEYLRWYRKTLDIAVENETEVTGIRPAEKFIEVETLKGDKRSKRYACTVVLATGFDGAGRWAVPDFIRDTLSSSRYDHTNGPVDFERFRGKRIAILGHAASAFDNTNIASEHGASHIDLCFRRPKLPRINPHRFLETAGTMMNFYNLPDAIKWEVACYFKAEDQPPPFAAFDAVRGQPRIKLHPGCPWLSVRVEDGEIAIETPKGVLKADHLLFATGSVIDLEARPELRSISPVILRWRDAFAPAASGERSQTLGALPHLGPHYEFKPKESQDEWVSRIFCFNFGSAVSHGPHSTSISGHRHCLPRLVKGIVATLFADQAGSFMNDLKAFSLPELDLPDGYEASLEQPEYIPL